MSVKASAAFQDVKPSMAAKCQCDTLTGARPLVHWESRTPAEWLARDRHLQPNFAFSRASGRGIALHRWLDISFSRFASHPHRWHPALAKTIAGMIYATSSGSHALRSLRTGLYDGGSAVSSMRTVTASCAQPERVLAFEPVSPPP